MPFVIKFYKKYFNAVDTCDHTMAGAEFKLKTNKWTVKLFTYVIKLCAYNGLILYNLNKDDKDKLTMEKYCLNLSEHFKNMFIDSCGHK